ncbi:MAG TPA: hypothetical protein VEI73_13810 [Candidatus Acidoferrum sp.]|nr:hypothetical protein [Candidatus Acidoferrum sp.]
MEDTRRRLILTIAGIAGSLTLEPLARSFQGPGVRPLPQPKPSPNAPDPHVPNGMDGPQPTVGDGKAVAVANQKELRDDVTRLYGIVSELKEQVQRTDSSAMLSVSLVKKAQQIEKLAKQIKELAKG